MGHILQALKQLEAKQASSQEAEALLVSEPASVVHQPPPVAEAAVEAADPSTEVSDTPPADSVVMPTSIVGPTDTPPIVPLDLHCLEYAPPVDVWTAAPAFPADSGPLLAGAGQTAPRDSQPPSPLEQAARVDLEDNVLGQQYRELTEHLLACLTSPSPTCMMFMGAEAQPHVTTTVMRVGLQMAETSSAKVLLIDGNLAEKTLSANFQLKGKVGLVDVLKRRACWQDAITTTASERLSVMAGGCGMLPGAAGEAEQWGPLLDQWKQHWQFLLIDAGRATSPLTMSLAKYCDAAYLLVRLGQTDATSAQQAISKLQSQGAPMNGCILTNVPVSRTSNGRYL